MLKSWVLTAVLEAKLIFYHVIKSRLQAAELDGQLIFYRVFRSRVLAAGLDDQLTAYLTWSYSLSLVHPSAWNSSRCVTRNAVSLNLQPETIFLISNCDCENGKNAIFREKMLDVDKRWSSLLR